MFYQVRWKTLPRLQGLACSDFETLPTESPNNEQGVAVGLGTEAERTSLLAHLEQAFGPQRFSNNAAAFEAVKASVLEWEKRQ